MLKHLAVFALLFVSAIAVAQTPPATRLAEKWLKRVSAIDAGFETAVMKADSGRFYALQKANGDRLKALKTVLADATRAGDFDAATEIKQRVTAAEASSNVRTRPKNTLKRGGHEYALIEVPEEWHVAKRYCEEMGGHLAIIDSVNEANLINELIDGGKKDAWVGATDEVEEGKWFWINGRPLDDFVLQRSAFDNSGPEGQHYLSILGSHWDNAGSSRRSYVCEWENEK